LRCKAKSPKILRVIINFLKRCSLGERLSEFFSVFSEEVNKRYDAHESYDTAHCGDFVRPCVITEESPQCRVVLMDAWTPEADACAISASRCVIATPETTPELIVTPAEEPIPPAIFVARSLPK
jgi:hypothetical protein